MILRVLNSSCCGGHEIARILSALFACLFCFALFFFRAFITSKFSNRTLSLYLRRTKRIDSVVIYENCPKNCYKGTCQSSALYTLRGVFPLTLKNDLSENENTVGWPFIS